MKIRFAAALLLSAAPAFAQQNPPPAEAVAPAVAGDVCADGKPHTFRLQENRDRLLATLAAEKGLDPCAFWGSLSLAERDIFEMTTAFLGSCDSRLAPPPSKSDETALDHAVVLYSINGPGVPDVVPAPVPSGGGACGGYDSNRVFMGFDQAGLDAMRAGHEDFGQSWGRILNPKHVRGYNWWRASNDPGGPHRPFTERDMICWGGMPCWIRFGNSEGPTFHFFAKDGDFNPAGLRERRGVCGVSDPRLVELTVGFNWDHESDPLCGADWRKDLVEKIGPANFRTYKPGGSCGAPPANIDPASGKDHGEAGLGPDLLNKTCAGSASAAASAPPGTPDLSGPTRAVERVENESLP